MIWRTKKPKLTKLEDNELEAVSGGYIEETIDDSIKLWKLHLLNHPSTSSSVMHDKGNIFDAWDKVGIYIKFKEGSPNEYYDKYTGEPLSRKDALLAAYNYSRMGSIVKAVFTT